MNLHTGEGPPGNGEAGQPEDHPAHIVEAAITPLITNKVQGIAGRRRRWVGRALNIACLDGVCINCTCGRSVSDLLGIEDSGVA